MISITRRVQLNNRVVQFIQAELRRRFVRDGGMGLSDWFNEIQEDITEKDELIAELTAALFEWRDWFEGRSEAFRKRCSKKPMQVTRRVEEMLERVEQETGIPIEGLRGGSDGNRT